MEFPEGSEDLWDRDGLGSKFFHAQSSGVFLGLGVKERGRETTQAEEKCPEAQGIVTSLHLGHCWT